LKLKDQTMIEEPPILTIKRTMRRPSDSQILAFQHVPTGIVVDALYGGGALSLTIQNLDNGSDGQCFAAGPALTADCGPADILATLASLKFIQNGDIVVSAFAGHQGCAAAGDRVIGMMKNSGAAGFITDGPVRDYDGIVSIGLPV
jgi:4-hydroxy-4-methyl-2-oxoglutarate aldolase